LAIHILNKKRLTIKQREINFQAKSALLRERTLTATSGSNTRDSVEKFPASDGQIACQLLHLAQTEDIWLKSALEGKSGLSLNAGKKK